MSVWRAVLACAGEDPEGFIVAADVQRHHGEPPVRELVGKLYALEGMGLLVPQHPSWDGALRWKISDYGLTVEADADPLGFDYQELVDAQRERLEAAFRQGLRAKTLLERLPWLLALAEQRGVPVEVRPIVSLASADVRVSLHARVGKLDPREDVEHLRETGSLVDELLAIVGEQDVELARRLRGGPEEPTEP